MTELERIQSLEGQVTALKDLLTAVLLGLPQSGVNRHLVKQELEKWLARRHLNTKPPANHFDDAYGKLIRHFLGSWPINS
ncbi:MAG: hypothetical protein OXC18_19150 [Desulfurellaceae bacterium]|nr:hypothetical protein [Desulfurellaceae bacterium]